MNKIFASILITAASMSFATVSSAATAEAKAIYKAAKESAETDYKVAGAKCKALSGIPSKVCVEEAKVARTLTKADAKVQYLDTPRARTEARKDIANAEYALAKTRCGATTGNDKDVCIKEAKAVKVALIADNKADKKVVDARTEARAEKHEANYKVAAEKCDALAGVAKDNCVASAKAQHGK
jgi:hypothetical protein